MTTKKPKRVTKQVWACPHCGHEVTGYNTLKNGSWQWEPIEFFGITDCEKGQVCMNWDAHHLYFFYHSPEAVEGGDITGDGE